MAPRKNANKKTKSPKASVEKNQKGQIQKKKPATGKASQIGKKARPSRGFRKPDPLQRENTSKAIILASSVPTQSQASKKASASTSRKGAHSPNTGPSSASARRISEYELAFQKKQPITPSTSRPPPPRHQTQAEINQIILDNQVKILENQATLAKRQEVTHQNIETLQNGQITLIILMMDLSTRLRNEDSPLNSANSNYGDLLGRLNNLTAFPTENSNGEQENDDDDDDGAQENDDDDDGADA